MIKALLIKADNTPPSLVEVRPRGYAEQIHDAVGGYFESHRVGPRAHMYLNEDGKMIGLPRNDTATALVEQYEPGFVTRDYIVGDVLVFGDNPPHEASVPSHIAAQYGLEV